MKKYIVTVDGDKFEVVVQEASAGIAAPVAQPAKPEVKPEAPKSEPKKEEAPKAAPVSSDGTKVNAPLPGTVLKVVAKQGQSVKQGEILCVLEAMKMENDIVAPQDGKIASVAVSEGATVGSGDLLFVIA